MDSSSRVDPARKVDPPGRVEKKHCVYMDSSSRVDPARRVDPPRRVEKKHSVYIRDHAQITTTEVVAFGLGNPSVSIPRNGKRTRQGSLTNVTHD